MIHQVNQQRLDTPPSPTSPPHHHHSNKGLHDDTTVFIAATQLLELSRRNGVLKPRDLREPGHLKRNSMTNVSCKDEVEMKGAVNGVGEEVKEDIHEGEGGGGGEGSGEGGKVEECRQREGEEKTQSEGGGGGEGREEEKMVCGQNGEAEGGNGEGEEEKEEETEMEVPEEKEDVHNDLLCGKILYIHPVWQWYDRNLRQLQIPPNWTLDWCSCWPLRDSSSCFTVATTTRQERQGLPHSNPITPSGRGSMGFTQWCSPRQPSPPQPQVASWSRMWRETSGHGGGWLGAGTAGCSGQTWPLCLSLSHLPISFL